MMHILPAPTHIDADQMSPIRAADPLVAAVGFGRHEDRTLFAGMVRGGRDHAICLLALNSHGNSHGGSGALRFQVVEVDRVGGTVYVLGLESARASIDHVGNVGQRLQALSRPLAGDTFVDRYLVEADQAWKALRAVTWTEERTQALIKELWGTAPVPATSAGEPGLQVQVAARTGHPQRHLTRELGGCLDAGSAFRRICHYLDNESEACARGDFTNDRDERLALGAGTESKQRAWRWIVQHTSAETA